ncbi:MAG: hypothetical protein QOK00_1173 [Thermoleophilaceae bacterium]|nr:hypothetical protein [Thermoleophilaceae bacterium]
MAARRPSGRAMVAATAALVALGGLGVGGWIAATDDDAPGQRPAPVAGAPSSDGRKPETEPAPSAPKAKARPADPKEGDGGGAAPAAAPTETAPGGTEQTRFPPARRERRARNTPKQFAVPPAREFSGRGNANLGTVDIRTSSVVKWSSRGSLTLKFGREDFPIVAPSTSGQLIVPPYSFEQVRVIAKGSWKISITPQS